MHFLNSVFKFYNEHTLGYLYKLLGNDGKNTKSKDIYLVAIAAQDPQGILSFPTKFEFKNFFKRDATLVYRKVSSMSDINQFSQEMKEQDNRINGLIIKAHGSHYSIALGPEESPPNGLETILASKASVSNLKPTFDRMEKNAYILLESCSTGKVKDRICIADKIADISGKKVFAPKHPVSTIDTELIYKNGKLKAKFYRTPKIHGKSTFAKITNLFIRIISVATFGLFPFYEEITSKHLSIERRLEKLKERIERLT